MTYRVDVLIFPGFQILDAAGPMAAFEIAGRLVPGAYDIHVIAAEAGWVESSVGAAWRAEGLPAAAPDTLVIAGGQGTQETGNLERLLPHVRQSAVSARRIASVCSGAYLLAAAGLLDGRAATTHWNRTSHFAKRFPKVKLQPDRIYTRDGCFWTSAGISAGIDLSLALIAEDLGEEVARQTARQLVIPHRRAGGQSQFSPMLEIQRADGRFAGLLDWARTALDQPLGVEQLADKACMSPRHFARAFAAETGVTPAKAIERLRLEAARALVEAGIRPLDAIARDTGFGDVERMRRAFVRGLGHPPQALRRAARTAKAA
jgi:transcriptional regulator GlxA family with amidase domain